MIVPPRKSSRALKSSTKQKSASKSANPNLGSHHATRNIAVMHNEINILTDVDILSVGLCYVGYDTKRQISCNIDRNMKRFKSFYGPDPTTIVPLFKDLRDKYPSFKYKEGLITLNWLFLNDKHSVLGGRWQFCEETVGPLVKKYAKMIQSLKQKKIKWRFTCNTKRFKATVDCSNFITNEFRLSPSGQWFDHKSNSSGLVSLYETDEFSFSPATLTTWLCCNMMINRNMKLALISSGPRLYHSEDHSHRQCTT